MNLISIYFSQADLEYASREHSNAPVHTPPHKPNTLSAMQITNAPDISNVATSIVSSTRYANR